MVQRYGDPDIEQDAVALNSGWSLGETMDLYAFGTKVHIRPPAASQVLDSSALLNG